MLQKQLQKYKKYGIELLVFICVCSEQNKERSEVYL